MEYFICQKCDQVIRNNPSAKDNTLICQCCGNKINLTNKKIFIFKNKEGQELPAYYKLYEQDDTVVDNQIIKDDHVYSFKELDQKIKW